MPQATDFIGAVYDQLAKLLNITDANPSVVMQMAWPGFSLSEQDFKPADQPTGPYNPQVAKETFSHLANIAPGLNTGFFQNTGLEVDDLYEILLSGAIPVGSTPDNIGNNPIYKLFGDAQYEFMQARTGSVGDPNAFYYPCMATPVNWYDAAAAASWPTLSLQSGDIKPAAPDSPFVKAGGLTLASKVWLLRPSSATGVNTIKLQAQQTLRNQQKALVNRTSPQMKTVTKPLSSQALHAVRSLSVAAPRAVTAARPSAALTRAPNLDTNMASANLASAKQRSLFTQKNVPSSAYSRYPLGKQLSALDLSRKKLEFGKVDVVNRYQLTNLINLQLPAKPAGSSDGFSITFKYCRVTIDRSWFKLALLKMKNWYMYGTQAGEYSTGSGSANAGMFPLLPTAFIAIRDLKITANWSQEDRQTLGQASALGFFDIRDGTLNANTLEVKGLQILGWISTLTPQLPPSPAP